MDEMISSNMKAREVKEKSPNRASFSVLPPPATQSVGPPPRSESDYTCALKQEIICFHPSTQTSLYISQCRLDCALQQATPQTYPQYLAIACQWETVMYIILTLGPRVPGRRLFRGLTIPMAKRRHAVSYKLLPGNGLCNFHSFVFGQRKSQGYSEIQRSREIHFCWGPERVANTWRTAQ